MSDLGLHHVLNLSKPLTKEQLFMFKEEMQLNSFFGSFKYVDVR